MSLLLFTACYNVKMENVAFNEIISSITQLNKEKKGVYKENIVEICRRDYNAYLVKVTLDLQKCIERNILKIVKNQYGKESYRITKDIEVKQQIQTDVDDSFSFIDSMYEEMKYKTLKEQLLKYIRLDVMNLIESSLKSMNQNTDTDPTDISLFHKKSFNVRRK